MGKGNPEAPDSALARGSSLLVGKKNSEKMKKEMDEANIHWVELGTKDGYKRLENVLNQLSIPCKPYHRNLQADKNAILPLILSDDIQTSVTPDLSNSDAELLIALD